MIANKRVGVRDLEFLSETKSSIISRVRHRHNDVCFNRKFSRQFASHLHAHFSDVHASDHAVGTCEVHVFKHTKCRTLLWKRPFRAQAVLVDDQHFARFDLANKLGMDEIKCACFRCEHIRPVEFAKRQRSPTERIAHRDQFLFAHDDQRKRALNPAQRRKDISAIV